MGVVPEAAYPHRKDTNIASVLVKKKHTAHVLCVHSRGLPWFVADMTDAAAFGGVVLDPEPAGSSVDEPNTEVQGLRVEWGFQAQSWTVRCCLVR